MKRLVVVLAVVALIEGACTAPSSFTEGNSPAGDDTYCGALTATRNPFYAGKPTRCGQAARDQCSTFEPTYSEAYRSAVVSCARQDSLCIADYGDCIKSETARATPSATQTKVKDEFCAVCPDRGDATVGPCSTFFTLEIPDGSAIGSYGAGSSVIYVSDNVAEEMRKTCIDATKCDGFAFIMYATQSTCQPGAGDCGVEFEPLRAALKRYGAALGVPWFA